ncbi:ribonuclease H-like domain-containing protein, partial [Tanacetum coccineum]
RSSLLTQPELPDIKDAFMIMCRDESHRGLGSASGVQKPQLMGLIGEKDNSGVQANMAGANQHITNSTKTMTNVVDISDLNITVGHPNGTIAKINHVGNLKLTNNVVLFDVLVIPEYTVSLLSVNKRIKDSKLHVGFNEHDCVIQDLKKENVLGTGSESGGLYMFDFNCKLPTGSMVYLIKSKDEVFGYFVDFVNLISNQFLKRVKVIRFDNGTEFINNRMDVFLRDKGIVHQTSCAYTPQQNGIAERKHRHHLNVARSLMFQGVLPHMRSLVEIIEHGLNYENQKVRTITALSLAALAEAAAPYGIESFDSVLKPLWKGIRSHCGKVLAAFLKVIGFIIPLMDADYASYYTKEVMVILIR